MDGRIGQKLQYKAIIKTKTLMVNGGKAIMVLPTAKFKEENGAAKKNFASDLAGNGTLYRNLQ